MDVIRLAAIITLVLLTACAEKKSVESVFPEQNAPQSKGCTTERINTSFIVSWEDGHMSLESGKGSEQFSKEFIEPNLQLINAVEFDKAIKVQTEAVSDVYPIALDTPDNWGVNKIAADQVWAQGVDGSGVLVAVVDAAVNYSHPQIAPRLAKNAAEASGQAGVDDDGNGLVDDVFGWNFYDNTPEGTPNPNEDHGTHVAGVILADPDYGTVKGVAPKARLIPVNFMSKSGSGSLGAAILGINYAVSRGAKIINASWGGPACSKALSDTVSQLGNKNVLFVAASGNDFVDYDREPWLYTYPAVFNFSHQLTVAATSMSDYMTSFSNRSLSLVHIGAPGESIVSTVTGGYQNMSGTSMAAPFVSGTAALLWSAKPNATVAQIHEAILKSVDITVGKEITVSSRGRLNAAKALAEIRRLVP